MTTLTRLLIVFFLAALAAAQTPHARPEAPLLHVRADTPATPRSPPHIAAAQPASEPAPGHAWPRPPLGALAFSALAALVLLRGRAPRGDGRRPPVSD